MPRSNVARYRFLAWLAILVVGACSSGEDFNVESSSRRAVEEAYGIPPGQTVELLNGSRVVFLGDSITVGGTEEGGYVTLVKEALRNLYPGRDIEVRGSGVVGDTVPDLARRLERDVLSRKPTHVVIYVGVNDVGGLGPGTAAVSQGSSQYRSGLANLVTRIQETGAWVMVCTPALIGEDPTDGSSANQALERYAADARQVAQALGTGLCDLRKEFTEYLESRSATNAGGGILTVDGIHLNAAGHRLVARTVLRELVTTATPIPVPEEAPSAPVETPSPSGTTSARRIQQRSPQAAGTPASRPSPASPASGVSEETPGTEETPELTETPEPEEPDAEVTGEPEPEDTELWPTDLLPSIDEES